LELKRTLFITPVVPSANGTGSQRRAWSHVTALSKISEVVIGFMPHAGAEGFQLIEHRQPKILLTDAERHKRAWSQFRTIENTIWRALIFAARLIPGEAARLSAQEASTASTLLPQCFDTVVCFKLVGGLWFYDVRPMLQWQPRLFVCDFDDIPSELAQRELESTDASWLRKLPYKLHNRAFGRAEKLLLQHADRVLVCSTAAKHSLEQQSGKRNIHVCHNVIDTPSALPAVLPTAPYQILFVGSLSYAPNVDALEFLLNDVWPLLEPSTYKLTIVGHNPSEQVLAFGQIPNVEVFANVPDLRTYYEKAHIVVAPIRFGSGTRIKIIEALAYGRPMISTTIGAEGLDKLSRDDLVIADTASDIAKSIAEVAQNTDLHRRLSLNGRRAAETHYSQETADSFWRSLVIGGS
jgi:polysaccharide biosynthesis protein PslH